MSAAGPCSASPADDRTDRHDPGRCTYECLGHSGRPRIGATLTKGWRCNHDQLGRLDRRERLGRRRARRQTVEAKLEHGVGMTAADEAVLEVERARARLDLVRTGRRSSAGARPMPSAAESSDGDLGQPFAVAVARFEGRGSRGRGRPDGTRWLAVALEHPERRPCLVATPSRSPCWRGPPACT